MLLVPLFLCYISGVENADAARMSAKVLARQSPSLESSVSTADKSDSWEIITLHGIPIFLPKPPYKYSLSTFAAYRGGSNFPVSTNLTCSQRGGPSSEPARVMMLKLATTGSTWIGGLLGNISNVRFRPELITGSGGERMADARKEKVMIRSVSACSKAVCGFSINSKNAANLNFGELAMKNNMKVVRSLPTLHLA